MLHEVVTASEEYEEGVRALFASVGLPIDESRWAMSFREGGVHGHGTGTPLAAVRAGRLDAFVIARPRVLRCDSERVPCLLLTDFLASPTDAGTAAARELLEALPRQHAITIAAGWSVAGNTLLRKANWRYAGPMGRYVMKPRKQARRRPPPAIPVASRDEREALLDAAQVLYIEEPRLAPPGGAEIVADADHGERLLKALRMAPQSSAEVAESLAAATDKAGSPLIASFCSATLEEAFLANGAARTSPRWGIFWTQGAADAPKRILEAIASTMNFHFFPQDLDL